MRQFQLRLGVVALALLSTGHCTVLFVPVQSDLKHFVPLLKLYFCTMYDITPQVTFSIFN